MLQLDNVSFAYADEPILEAIRLRIKKGAYEGIIGASGCGKTTLIKLIMGLHEACNGSISRDFKRLGFVCQNDTLIEEISILRNITYVCHDRSVAKRCLEMVGLGGLPADKRVATLSKGMKKRVEIARALSISPDFLIMDEPFSSLDYVSKVALIAQMKHFLAPQETAFLYVTHDIGEALVICDHLTVLSTKPARILQRFENIQQQDKQLLKRSILQLLENNYVPSYPIKNNIY